MPDRIDQIYKILINYIQDDNKDKAAIRKDLADSKEQLGRIETQTTKTNGRVTKLESQFLLIEDKDKKQVIIGAFKKKQVAVVLGLIAGAWSLVSVLVYAWLQKKFFD